MMTVVFWLLKFTPLWILKCVAWCACIVLCFFKNSSLYRSIHINLMLINPHQDEQEHQQLIKTALFNQLYNTLISAKTWVMPSDWAIQNITHIHNEHLLKKAINHPNGMLIIVPHLGVWEMMNAWVSQFGKLTIMYKPVKNPAINTLMLQGRTRLDATLVPTDSTGVKAIFKTLKSGGFSVLLPDHVPDLAGGVVVPFFGIPTLTGILTAKLAHKTNCALIGLACIKKDDGFHVFCYDLDDENLYHKDPIIATTALNQAMETMINEHLLNYMWGYRRFKHTPIAENLYLMSIDDIHHARLNLS